MMLYSACVAFRLDFIVALFFMLLSARLNCSLICKCASGAVRMTVCVCVRAFVCSFDVIHSLPLYGPFKFVCFPVVVVLYFVI